MKVTELRIGNHIQYWMDGVMCIEGQVEPAEIATLSEDVIKPIPLTEEWLERLSEYKVKFEQRGNGQDYQPQDYISYEGNDYHFNEQDFVRFTVWRWKDKDGKIQEDPPTSALHVGDEYIKDVDQVHKLQNLYYALRELELTIKELA